MFIPPKGIELRSDLEHKETKRIARDMSIGINPSRIHDGQMGQFPTKTLTLINTHTLLNISD